MLILMQKVYFIYFIKYFRLNYDYIIFIQHFKTLNKTNIALFSSAFMILHNLFLNSITVRRLIKFN